MSEYIKKVMGLCEEGTTLISEYINARTKITLKCTKGHLRITTTNAIVSQNSGRVCKECRGLNQNGKKLDSTVQEEFLSKGFTKLEEYKGALVKILAKNNNCGHEYLVRPSDVARGRALTCQKCNPSRRIGYTNTEFNEEIAQFDLETVTPYKNMKTNILVKNSICGHTYDVNPGHLLYDNIGIECKICTNSMSIKNRFFSELINNNIELKEEYTTCQDTLEVKNNNCGHEYNVIPNNLVCGDSGLICRTCSPLVRVSKGEQEIYEFIIGVYPGWVIQSERQILNNNKELDIVIPDLGIAIEYNGVRWHDESSRGASYHLDKTEELEKYGGYRLVHILDTEWIKSPEIVKSRLLSILGKCPRKIYARKTIVKEIPFPHKFLQENHIQGAGTPTKYNYGLYLGEELIAVMTFGTPRFSTAAKYELIRFCSLLNTSVAGGASKLLKYFVQMYGKSIISYADRRWSTGNLYKELGFGFVHNSKPNYRYYKYKYSLSRYQCQKHLLKRMFPDIWEESKSESTIMKEAGYYKVYDCGNSVWLLE